MVDYALITCGVAIVETAAEAIKRIAEQEFETGKRYIHLAELGNLLRAAGVELPSGMRLRDVIEHHCLDHLKLLQHPDLPLVWVAVPADRDEPTDLPVPPSRRLPDEHSFLAEIHHNFLVAFCKTIDVGQNVYVRPRAPVRFFVSDGNPPPGYIEVPASLRLPGVIVSNLRAMPEDERTALASRVRRFMEQHEITETAIAKRSALEEAPRAEVRRSALERLVMAQTESVRRQLVIPAEIAVLLSRN